MSSAVNMIDRGVAVGTGAAKKVVLGWKPAVIQLENVDGGVSALKTDKMEGDKAVKKAGGAPTFPADMVTIENDGFTLGADADLNAAGEKVHYAAWQARND